MSENQNSSREQGMEKYFFRASAADFRKIPGEPIVYWVSNAFLKIFETNETLGRKTKARQGLATGDNSIFARLWYEVSETSFCTNAKSCIETQKLKEKWFPYNKGGEFRRWYGNIQWLVNWSNDGEEIRSFKDEKGKLRSRPQNTDCYFQEGITWSDVTSGHLSVRALPPGCVYDISGHSAFPQAGVERYSVLAYLNTKFSKLTAKMLNPTLHFQIGDYQSFPYPEKFIRSDVEKISKECVFISKSDWDSFETSWDFSSLPLLHADYRQPTLNASYQKLRAHWREMTLEMQRLEQENNRIFIEAYGLQDELTPEVPLNEITLTCNPHYRYGGDKTEEELEAMLLADTMRELVSYAIGCMMGRYSLDEPGLIYAHAGNFGFDATRYLTFPADADGIVPITDEFWFEDDAANRVREFLLAVWGADTLDENMAWLAESLGAKANETPGETIRRYLSSSFFKDHLQTYKKRPIYWLFSSGKQKAFEALVYLHRYNEGTLARMRAEYVVPLTGKMAERIKLLEDDALKASTPAARKKIDKDIEKLKKKLDELRTYDEKLRHFADMRISLDLDDGVKANYGKFGDLLAEVKSVTGGAEE